MIAAIVLSAGASSRMGKPKALLAYRGATFLKTILDAAYAAGIERRVVVLGVDSDNILSHHALHGIAIATNLDVERGPIGSIVAGLNALINHPVDAALVWQVDRPQVSVRTLEALIDRFRVSRPAITLPTFAGRRGHPVLFSRDVFSELIDAAHANQDARAVVRRDAARVAEVAVDDAAVLADVDTPEDYERLLRDDDARKT